MTSSDASENNGPENPGPAATPQKTVENAASAKPPRAPRPPALQLLGRPLETPQDVATLLSVSHSHLMYLLFKAEPSERYRNFEIPKRTGGMRLISAPHGLVRECQDKLTPLLMAAYEAHPSAHGFLPARNVVTNAQSHLGQRLVLNIDLEDFFPSINFGRIRGLFMAPPFSMASGAASVMAQIVTYRNGLPQGAPTSPILSNFIAATLDRRLTRLAKENGLHYSRYADDITFSTNKPTFPPALAYTDGNSGRVLPGEALERAISASGFTINYRKVRLQTQHQRQMVTGLVVNSAANVQRQRVRKIRAMIHAWEKFGLDKAGYEHFTKYRALNVNGRGAAAPENPGKKFRNIVYGQLSFLKMVRGKEDPVFLKLCAKLVNLDPNPSRFIREMAFGGADYDVFISHASEDKAEIARPIFEALAKRGIKCFLDEAHIGWGDSFTTKINTALGAARTVLCIISPTSVTKEWPVAEVNAALSMSVIGQKNVMPLIVGKPDLSKLPLIFEKDQMTWTNDPEKVAAEIEKVVKGAKPARGTALPGTAVPVTSKASPPQAAWPFPTQALEEKTKQNWKPGWRDPPPEMPKQKKKKRELFGWLFGKK